MKSAMSRRAPRPASMKVMEHAIQVGLFAWRELAQARHPELELLHAIPNGAGLKHTVKRTASGGKTRFSAEGQKLRKEGLTSGIPDVGFPVARGPHHGMYIEHKTKTGPVSPSQRRKIKLLLAQGYAVILSRDTMTSIDAIKAYLALGPFDPSTPGFDPPTLPKTRQAAPP